MPGVVAPNQDFVQGLVRQFVLSILPQNIEVIQGQDNRVPEPTGINNSNGATGDWVEITAMFRTRLETNIDGNADCLFVGSITPGEFANGTLTVTQVEYGTLIVGIPVYGSGATALENGVVLLAQLSGTGGVGTYSIAYNGSLGSSFLANGQISATMNTEIMFQFDVHGPASGDNAQIICTMFRDPYAVNYFNNATELAGYGTNVVAPLYADEAKQVPFWNENDQQEFRWIVEAHVQANMTVTVAQQYFTAVGPVILHPLI